jgi:uncharacterized membrane protein YdbT with pleckstrin-like domain
VRIYKKGLKVMALINCLECGKEIYDKAEKCINCGFVIPKKVILEETLLEVHPAMFRSRPVTFMFCVALCFLLIGFVFLFFWWLSCKARVITITNKRTVIKKGLISKHTNEILHSHIRNIQVRQGVINRIFDVGTLMISSSGQAEIELVFSGLVNPDKAKGMIEEHRQ